MELLFGGDAGDDIRSEVRERPDVDPRFGEERFLQRGFILRIGIQRELRLGAVLPFEEAREREKILRGVYDRLDRAGVDPERTEFRIIVQREKIGRERRRPVPEGVAVDDHHAAARTG